MTAESIRAAAEITRVIKEAANHKSFTMLPPAKRDLALQDRVNALWQVVHRKLDETQVASLNEAGLRDAILCINQYIGNLAQSDKCALSEYAVPFKAAAANVIRDKVKTAFRNVDAIAGS